MTQKISFSVEDAKVISQNPDSNFAVLSLDFFASGENLHNMYVSEETLLKTASSIKNCPLIWKYDEKLDDAYTHDIEEVPCGFVPESSSIEKRKLKDGRTMLSVVAYLWKRYTGDLVNIFKRDGGQKPISVEMSVFDTKVLPNGFTELLDFRYEGITVLGSYVTPAIPLANASVLSFSKIKKEYEEDIEKEFHYIPGDLKIPEEVKENAREGLKLRKKYNVGGTSVGVSFAKSIIQDEEISPAKAAYIAEYFSKNENIIQPSEPPTEAYISSLLFGGNISWKWAKSIVDEGKRKRELLNNSLIVTFPYKSIADMNPALKGISPPITVAQGNEIARQADAIGNDDKKNGWAIAISSFKKTHTVKDGKWVKKSQNTEMSMDKEKEEAVEEMAEEKQKEEAVEEMAQETPSEEKQEAEEEKKEAEEEQKEADEEKKESEEKMSFQYPSNFNFEKVTNWFADGEEEDVMMAKEEVKKGEFANPQVMMSAMFTMLSKMSEAMEKMAEENKVYMQENEELKKFRFDFEVSQKNFEVDKTLKELSEKVVLPDEAKEEMLAEAEKYTFATIEEWKKYCKAKSFDFAVKENTVSTVVKIGLPFSATNSKKKDDLWAS